MDKIVSVLLLIALQIIAETYAASYTYNSTFGGVVDKNYCGIDQNGVNCTEAVNFAKDRPSYEKGESTVMYVTATYVDTDKSTKVVTAQFMPRVDSFTTVLIPDRLNLMTKNSLKLMVNFLGPTTANGAVQFIGPLVNNKPDARAWFNTTNGGQAVPFRSVVVTMDRGQFRSVNWESTFCLFANRACIDNMWGEPLKSVTGFKIYVMWAGTDAQGNFFNSGTESVYKLQMLP